MVSLDDVLCAAILVAPRRHFNTRSRAIKTIQLLRHGEAKAAGGLPDDERPLTPRGEEVCHRLRRYFEDHGVGWDLVLCSSALRAVETCRLAVAEAGGESGAGTDVQVEPGLYLAGTETLLARLRTLDESIQTVLLVGHNPGLQSLAHLLIGTGGGRLVRRLYRDFPAGAWAALEADSASWAGLGPGCGRLRSVVMPRDLAEASA